MWSRRSRGVAVAIFASARSAAALSAAVALVPHPARAQHQRLQFVGIEHQRRQEEAAAQHVADAGRAVDRRAELGQGLDVAVDGALGNAELSASGRP
jgi:uncharacterized protein involved in type VI secretion and phage assembly